MSRFMSSTAILLALTLGATANTAAAGNAFPFLQRATENRAEIEQHREAPKRGAADRGQNLIRSFVILGRQNLRANQAVSNNKVATDQQGSANIASTAQFGQSLTGTLTQAGSGNTATVRQIGMGSTTTIAQAGDNNTACVIQIGRNLDASLTQTGNQSTALLQTKKGTREIPVEVCTRASNRIATVFGRI